VACLAAAQGARAGELRPLELSKERAIAQPQRLSIDPRVYEQFEQHARRMTAQERSDAIKRYSALRTQAVQRGNREAIRHYARLIEILQQQS
jgi:hypothetical protein